LTPTRRQWLGLAAAGLVLPNAGAQIQQVQHLAPTARLPAFRAQDAQGGAVPVPAPGKPSLVNFWATWCPPCRTEMPLLEQVAQFYDDKLVFQPVNHKERIATVQRAMQSSGWKIPLILDPEGAGARAWDVRVFPTTVGFDAQGRPRWRVAGEYDWSSAAAAQLIEGLWR
jgi:thiol-disulfide isomerase/thioredoxin